tara:strand:- start:28309 stop:29100 length:792 start_codon:yes stop_codon:yes gene_type:complete
MYTININPILFELGFLKIRYYGLIYALGFILFYLTMYYVAKKQLIPNFDKDNVDTYVLYIMISIVLGARVFEMLFYQFNTLITNPIEILMIWHGGLSFHGGLAGLLLATWLFCKKNKINIWKLLDISSVIGIFTLILGRIANLINQELVGTPSTAKWCMIFPRVDNICRHPYQIYASLSHLLLFLFLIFIIYINRHKIKTFIGTKKLSIMFLIGYGVLRIITDIWKLENLYFGLKTGQWLSIVMIAVGVWLLIFRKRKTNKKL